VGAQAKRKNQASAGFLATQASLKKTNKTPNIQRKVIEYDKDDRLTKFSDARGPNVFRYETGGNLGR
jgi:hypothetical protein